MSNNPQKVNPLALLSGSRSAAWLPFLAAMSVLPPQLHSAFRSLYGSVAASAGGLNGVCAQWVVVLLRQKDARGQCGRAHELLMVRVRASCRRLVLRHRDGAVERLGICLPALNDFNS